jgi:uncharacterized protein (TIGR02284 family)
MASKGADTLNSLLRGEVSAVETYQQALDKLGDTKGAAELRRIHVEHRDAANSLRKEIREHGEEPEPHSSAWRAFAKAVEGTAKLFGNDAAMKALKEGEELGVKDYEKALKDTELPAECRSLIASTLLSQAREHIEVLDRLMAGLVDRIGPREARQRVESGVAMLVCAYDSDDKFQEYHLEGAISLHEFETRADAIPKDRELIFYCA